MAQYVCSKCGQEGSVLMAKYKVVSRHEVLGHKPGEVFEAELSESHNQLIGVGHLALVIDAPKAPPAPAAAPTSTPKEA